MQPTDEDSSLPFPWRYVSAFLICVALTGLAILIANELHMPHAVTVVIILGMALVQVILQLTLLLHASFKDERWVRLAALLGGTFIAVVVVSFTYLVMTFQSGVS
ncbi:hypothetical protein Heshes_17930 [Alicyclobacillus hesperidum]|uniref:Cytochrome C oxidase subunit IV n=1 Tax=Alicyclobacillus hesperidum TaxID=89784 RepID=A0A1H2U6W2_9BACL|nr:cytochrome C oxidase subunit IV family protein [Alicyclobacillus hesperidum]GLV14109.1 hypothetical protein Heshes_17930 [Alicyclobacillus hesperidum]SDW51983.1 Cytochrome C oxidase subunit IV [Alicyclobacillus hesperidum]